jgi:hypothetical protein
MYIYPLYIRMKTKGVGQGWLWTEPVKTYCNVTWKTRRNRWVWITDAPAGWRTGHLSKPEAYRHTELFVTSLAWWLLGQLRWKYKGAPLLNWALRHEWVWGCGGILLVFLTSSLDEVNAQIYSWVSSIQHPLSRRPSGPQSCYRRDGDDRNRLPLPGFQSVAYSVYWATPIPSGQLHFIIFMLKNPYLIRNWFGKELNKHDSLWEWILKYGSNNFV